MMNRAMLKNVTFAAVIVLVGVVLRSIDSLSRERVWRWSLGDLVAWASFTAAAAIAAYLAGELAARESRPVAGSQALSRILGVVAFGVSLWLLHTAAKPVLTSAWRGTVQKVFAFGIVTLAGYLLWRAHQGFDEIAAALAPRAAAAAGAPAPQRGTPPNVAEPQQQAPAAAAPCPRCGASMAAGQRFCGSCGSPLPVTS